MNPPTDHNVFHALVRGKVQGVGFRVFTRAAALRHRCTGWVRNLADGRVEVYAEGTELALTELLTEIHKGPPWGHVADIEVEWFHRDATHDNFVITR